ncbi:MAG: hypothetical protein ACRC2R_16935 [Xenococcaceae cyanobacterium]
MDEFQLTTDLACDVIEAIRNHLAYPLMDSEKILKMRLQCYDDDAFKNSSFHGDRARESLNKVLMFLVTYLRNPTGDNYYWLNNALSDHRWALKTHLEEVTTNE